MNQIYAVQNNRVALTVYEHLNRTRTWRGQQQAIPAVRFELTPKIEHSPGRYSLDRTATLGHNLSLDKARLLFFDLAHDNFNADYQVVFRNDNGSFCQMKTAPLFNRKQHHLVSSNRSLLIENSTIF